MREEDNTEEKVKETVKTGRFSGHDGGLPTVGVFPALSEAFEDSEEELSARASGAAGGGLAFDVLGGLNGRT